MVNFKDTGLNVAWLVVVGCLVATPGMAEDDAADAALIEAMKITDDQRITFLRPTLSAKEADNIWFGKAMKNQACGGGRDESGRTVPMFINSYEFKLGDGRKFWMGFKYLDHKLSAITGPGFEYVRKDGKFLRAEVPLGGKEQKIELPK